MLFKTLPPFVMLFPNLYFLTLPPAFQSCCCFFSNHFGGTGEQRGRQMDCSKTVLSISLLVFQTEQLSRDGAQVSEPYMVGQVHYNL